MIGQEVADIVSRSESEHLEFKRAYAPDEVARAAAAFLNSGGGTVVLGVDQSATDRRAVGVEDAAKKAEQLERALSRDIVPRALIAVSVVPVEGDRGLVVVDVPAAAEPPYVYGGQIWVRQGSATRTATASDIVEMISRRQQEAVRWERQPASGVELGDLATEEIVRTAAEARERRLVELGDAPAEVLARLELAGGGRIRNSAVVLFGREPSRIYPQTQIRVARFETECRDVLRDNRALEGNAFELMDAAWDFVTRHAPIRSMLGTDYHRVDRPAYPLHAIREAILNALVHRDYSSYSGSVSLSLYPNRFEIWNPGRLPEGIAITELKRGTVSRPHNPDIAYAFYLRGLVERLGTGTRRIVEECREAGLPEPRWEEVGGGIRLTIFLRPDAEITTGELGDRALAYLHEAAPGTEITVAEYHERFAPHRTDRTARTDLARLVEFGFLRRAGRGPGTRYVRTELPLRHGSTG